MPQYNPALYNEIAEPAIQPGIKMPGVVPGSMPMGEGMDLNQLLLSLRNGQMSPEVLLQLLAALAGAGGQMPGAEMLGGGGSPIQAAFMGQ